MLRAGLRRARTRRPGPRGPGRRSLAAWLAAGLLVAGGLLASPSGAAGQTRADSAAVLIDAARRLAAEGRAEVAQTLYRYVVERYGGTAAAEEAARLLAGGGPERDGRVELQVWGTLYGLWLGVGLPLAAGADDPEPYGLGLLLGGPAGFFGSRAYARSRPLSVGQARAITLGGTWGSWQGLGWALVADVGQEERRICPDPQFPEQCFTDQEGDSSEEIAAAVIAGGLVGIVTGAILARKPISQGVASTVNFGALWGTWFGVAAGVLMDREDDDLLAATLIGGDVGLLATGLLAPAWDLTRERARLISIAGVLGGLAGAGIDLLVQPDDEKVAIAIPLVGSIAGLALGASTTRDRAAAGGVRDDSSPGANGLPMPTLLRVHDAPGRTRLVPGLTFAVRF